MSSFSLAVFTWTSVTLGFYQSNQYKPYRKVILFSISCKLPKSIFLFTPSTEPEVEVENEELFLIANIIHTQEPPRLTTDTLIGLFHVQIWLYYAVCRVSYFHIKHWHLLRCGLVAMLCESSLILSCKQWKYLFHRQSAFLLDQLHHLVAQSGHNTNVPVIFFNTRLGVDVFGDVAASWSGSINYMCSSAI